MSDRGNALFKEGQSSIEVTFEPFLIAGVKEALRNIGFEQFGITDSRTPLTISQSEHNICYTPTETGRQPLAKLFIVVRDTSVSAVVDALTSVLSQSRNYEPIILRQKICEQWRISTGEEIRPQDMPSAIVQTPHDDTPKAARASVA